MLSLGWNRVKTLIVAISLGAILLGLAPLTAFASSPQQTTIRNVYSGMCLDAYTYTVDFVVPLEPCNGSRNQLWNFIVNDRDNCIVGCRIIENLYNGLCLDVWQNIYTNKQPIFQHPCDTQDPAELFYVVNGHCGSFCAALYTWSDANRYVIEDYNWNTYSGSFVDIWRPNTNGYPGSNQKWYFACC
jgi:hypothetical protein